MGVFKYAGGNWTQFRQLEPRPLEVDFHYSEFGRREIPYWEAMAQVRQEALEALTQIISDMRAPGFRLHALKGDRKGYWPVSVKANWHVIFRFADGDASSVELLDYH